MSLADSSITFLTEIPSRIAQDAEAKQALLHNFVQLQNGKGLELSLPGSKENQTTPKQS